LSNEDSEKDEHHQPEKAPSLKRFGEEEPEADVGATKKRLVRILFRFYLVALTHCLHAYSSESVFQRKWPIGKAQRYVRIQYSCGVDF
jgi:hypothetical protein